MIRPSLGVSDIMEVDNDKGKKHNLCKNKGLF